MNYIANNLVQCIAHRWAILNVAAGYSQAVNDDKLVMMAAGYLEGALTNA